MKTIYERAHIAIGHPLPRPGVVYVPEKLKLEEQTFVNGYIQGAKDQRDIDIEKAISWLQKNTIKYTGMFVEHKTDNDNKEIVGVHATIDMQLYEDLKKAMECDEKSIV